MPETCIAKEKAARRASDGPGIMRVVERGNHGRPGHRARHTATAMMLALACSVSACDGGGNHGSDGGDARARWACPSEWVSAASGGCGPAVLLCVPDGGAAPGACDGVDWTHPHDVPASDGGVGRAFYRRSDGTLGGGWIEPGDPGGAPSDSWLPDGGSGDGAYDWTPSVDASNCPDGWTSGANRACDPIMRTDCPTGTAPLPGGGCTATGASDCPAGSFADVGAEAVGATVMHVASGSDPSIADGSEAHPFATIADGVRAAGASGWVLVAAGSYAETLALSQSIHIVGVCAAHVHWTGSAPATLTTTGSTTRLDLRGVSIGGTGEGIRVTAGSRLSMRHVVVEGATSRGIRVTDVGTTLDGDDVLVSDTRSDSTGVGGRGIEVTNAAVGSTTHAAFVGNVETGAQSFGASSALTLSDALVRDTRARADGLYGRGLDVEQNGTLTVERTVVEHNVEAGAAAYTGGQLIATNLAVRDVAPSPPTGVSAGVLIFSGSTATIVHGHVTQAASAGILAREASRVALADVAIEAIGDTAPQDGDGVLVSTAAQMTGDDVRITDIAGSGISVTDDGSAVNLSRSVVRGSRPAHSLNQAAGAVVAAGGTFQGTFVLFDDNIAGAFEIIGAGSSLTLRDSVLRQPPDVLDNAERVAIQCQWSAAVDAARVVMAGSRGAALLAQHACTATLADSRIQDTHPTRDLRGGYAIGTETAGQTSVTRTLIADSAYSGCLASDSGTVVRIDSSCIRTTHQAQPGYVAPGLAASTGGRAEISRSIVERNEGLGIYAEGMGSSLAVSDTVVRDTATIDANQLGRGIAALGPFSVQIERVLVSNSREVGVEISQTMLEADLRDVLVEGVSPSAAGMGLGLQVHGGSVSATRLAIDRASAAAVAALPEAGALAFATIVTLDSAYVRDVRASSIQIDDSMAGGAVARGASVAYGVHVGTDATLRGTFVTIDGGGFGFFDSSGTLELHHASISNQVDGFGAVSGGPGATLLLDDVNSFQDAVESVLQLDNLPQGSSLPAPAPVCPPTGCM